MQRAWAHGQPRTGSHGVNPLLPTRPGHCDCPDCVDYGKAGSQPRSGKAAPPARTVPQKALPKFRPDGRCGPNFVAPGSLSYGECDPTANADQKGPCCNPQSGWCGNVRGEDWGHCDCPEVRINRFLPRPRAPILPGPPVDATCRLIVSCAPS